MSTPLAYVAESSLRVPFFCAPPMGRRILAGFSHLQRVGKAGATDVWFPQKLLSAKESPMEWAAVRQFDLLQESGNLQIYDMDVGDLKYTLENITKMRAGGYRITVITLGDYQKRMLSDDLLRLDLKLQDEITRIIHFLYLQDISQHLNETIAHDLATEDWSIETHLEHVALSCAAKRLYKPEKETLAEKAFFKILGLLSKHHIIHETGVGLQLPDATKEKNWVYIAKGENQLWRFQQTITTFFEALDDERATMTHMRGYGDQVSQGYKARQRENLTFLARK